jgi:hypothetical protein
MALIHMQVRWAVNAFEMNSTFKEVTGTHFTVTVIPLKPVGAHVKVTLEGHIICESSCYFKATFMREIVGPLWDFIKSYLAAFINEEETVLYNDDPHADCDTDSDSDFWEMEEEEESDSGHDSGSDSDFWE